jgi:hypothetical protein
MNPKPIDKFGLIAWMFLNCVIFVIKIGYLN